MLLTMRETGTSHLLITPNEFISRFKFHSVWHISTACSNQWNGNIWEWPIATQSMLQGKNMCGHLARCYWSMYTFQKHTYLCRSISLLNFSTFLKFRVKWKNMKISKTKYNYTVKNSLIINMYKILLINFAPMILLSYVMQISVFLPLRHDNVCILWFIQV